jgi:alpha-amylase
MLDGIPIFYYGDEQYFKGGDDPLNREPLFSHFNRESWLYMFTHTLVNFRLSQNLWTKPQIQRYADDNFYAFTRDNVLAMFTNTDNFIARTITYHSYKENTKLCNLFKRDDCVYVRNNRIDVTLQGDSKVLVVIQ